MTNPDLGLAGGHIVVRVLLQQREFMENLISSCNLGAFTYYSRLARLKSYVASNLAERITLVHAASIVGLEQKYFSAFFRRKVGVPFTVWLRHVRIEAATELMKSRNYPISSVAYRVGFQDLRTFQRVFKQALGTTPSDFKNSVRPA